MLHYFGKETHYAICLKFKYRDLKMKDMEFDTIGVQVSISSDGENPKFVFHRQFQRLQPIY